MIAMGEEYDQFVLFMYKMYNYMLFMKQLSNSKILHYFRILESYFQRKREL